MKISISAWAVIVFAVLAASSQNLASPLEKVVELLNVLKGRIDKDGKDDARMNEKQTSFLNKEIDNAKAIIQNNKDKISTLTADLKEAEAFQAGKQRDLVDLANKQALRGSELDIGKNQRTRARGVFETNEAIFVQSLDQLQRALAVMRKKMGNSASASSASLISVADKLKKTLMQGSDFALSTAQRETLNNFLATAHATDNGQQNSEEDSAPHDTAPSFLQQGLDTNGLKRMLASGSTPGLERTLEDLKTSVAKEKESAVKAEERERRDHKGWESGLVASLENGKKSLADIKISISESQQQTSQKQTALLESQQIFKTESEHLVKLETELRQKKEQYKLRSNQRADEATAVQEALKILSGEINTGAGAGAGSFMLGTGQDGTDHSSSSFLQLSLMSKKAHHDTSAKVSVPGLSFVALRSVAHHRSNAQADPFAKVKNMLKGMLRKLTEKQAQEAKRAAWCDSEISKTTTEKKRTETSVQKQKDRLESVIAELTEVKSDIQEITKDLEDMTEALTYAKGLRQAEHQMAHESLKQYKEAAAVLKSGLKILKNYYEKKGGSSSKVGGKSSKDRAGLGTGIIGILEISVDDFEKLHAETKQAEETSAREFEERQSETNIRTAVFQKDLEFKTSTRVKLEFEESTMRKDLKSHEQELTAIEAYMEKLQTSCTVKGPSYEEKQAKRQAELNGLKEAYSALRSQGGGR